MVKIEDIHENIKQPSGMKRCPKCAELSFQFDPETGKAYCTRCGFEYNIEKR